jgi:hypothetical protein
MDLERNLELNVHGNTRFFYSDVSSGAEEFAGINE